MGEWLCSWHHPSDGGHILCLLHRSCSVRRVSEVLSRLVLPLVGAFAGWCFHWLVLPDCASDIRERVRQTNIFRAYPEAKDRMNQLVRYMQEEFMPQARDQQAHTRGRVGTATMSASLTPVTPTPSYQQYQQQYPNQYQQQHQPKATTGAGPTAYQHQYHPHYPHQHQPKAAQANTAAPRSRKSQKRCKTEADAQAAETKPYSMGSPYAPQQTDPSRTVPHKQSSPKYYGSEKGPEITTAPQLLEVLEQLFLDTSGTDDEAMAQAVLAPYYGLTARQASHEVTKLLESWEHGNKSTISGYRVQGEFELKMIERMSMCAQHLEELADADSQSNFVNLVTPEKGDASGHQDYDADLQAAIQASLANATVLVEPVPAPVFVAQPHSTSPKAKLQALQAALEEQMVKNALKGIKVKSSLVSARELFKYDKVALGDALRAFMSKWSCMRLTPTNSKESSLIKDHVSKV